MKLSNGLRRSKRKIEQLIKEPESNDT